jgi:hypothetical protein
MYTIASEQSARMVAMRNAREAATDLIASLTLRYNKARQEAITKELLDIAGGAEALAKVTSLTTWATPRMSRLSANDALARLRSSNTYPPLTSGENAALGE